LIDFDFISFDRGKDEYPRLISNSYSGFIRQFAKSHVVFPYL